jgi:hypothetical protein
MVWPKKISSSPVSVTILNQERIKKRQQCYADEYEHEKYMNKKPIKVGGERVFSMHELQHTHLRAQEHSL